MEQDLELWRHNLFSFEQIQNEEDNVESETPIIKDDVTQFPITAEIFVPPDGGYGWLIGK